MSKESKEFVATMFAMLFWSIFTGSLILQAFDAVSISNLMAAFGGLTLIKVLAWLVRSP